MPIELEERVQEQVRELDVISSVMDHIVMKKGSMMARRPVTSNAEHRPNKERQRLRQKS